MSRLRIGARIVLPVVVVFGVWVIYVQIRHVLGYGHFVPPALHADVTTYTAPIGIPGITKTYEATLTNYGLFPVPVETCSFTSDTNSPGTIIAYNIEQWDTAKRAWVRVMEFAKPDLCTPMPASMGNTKWHRSWLWPSQSVSTGEEATGARGPFKKGDMLRFVVVTDVTGRAARDFSYPTPSFILDEQMLDNEMPYRTQH